MPRDHLHLAPWAHNNGRLAKDFSISDSAMWHILKEKPRRVSSPGFSIRPPGATFGVRMSKCTAPADVLQINLSSCWRSSVLYWTELGGGYVQATQDRRSSD